ncbi:eye-specific diacylglycerol kinase-like [Sitodiplosis mosellana]|uniref:eye-specific diacylglycerol kinase-like n=1 Tax=Sitodiplosis mosellana TaxID=263140 RepID=UPI0024449B31|nr:eye-specific diacylglycerol kinase-like [Sitodiplosis mosellana]
MNRKSIFLFACLILTLHVVNGGFLDGIKRLFGNLKCAYGISQEYTDDPPTSGNETSKSVPLPDWSVNAKVGDHLWQATSDSGDICDVGKKECSKRGPRMKCSACKMVAHTSCMPIITKRQQLSCKPSFIDESTLKMQKKSIIDWPLHNPHHWMYHQMEKGEYRQCEKCQKLIEANSFSLKKVVAVSCPWCKLSFHNKESCFNSHQIGDRCTFGQHSKIIVPPSWIVKQKKYKPFVIKPIPMTEHAPLLVFINPKSGGNMGGELLEKFQWLLNPRQVFYLTRENGPRMGLELFRDVPNLRILACGGDGTAGWIFSELDRMQFTKPPAVGVLPLGTGNDLARSFGWGGGYDNEPISTILKSISDSNPVLLDRWSLKVTPNLKAKYDEDGKDDLPQHSKVVNNYFSFGIDAHIALKFHEARENHPDVFNSPLVNKLYYGQAGGKDLLVAKWEHLSEIVTLECNGTDITPELKKHRVHAVLFLNIPFYGGGTRPWASPGKKQATDDGLIEVIGLTSYQLPLLQVGRPGTCIAQCKTAKIITSQTIPMQVDGEATKLRPSIIELSLLNKASMLAKKL